MPSRKKKKNGRGGARPDAGRKKGPPAVYHGLRLSPAVSRWLKTIVRKKTKPGEPKMTVSRLVDQIVQAEMDRRRSPDEGTLDGRASQKDKPPVW